MQNERKNRESMHNEWMWDEETYSQLGETESHRANNKTQSAIRPKRIDKMQTNQFRNNLFVNLVATRNPIFPSFHIRAAKEGERGGAEGRFV